jgi:hypothetical protein
LALGVAVGGTCTPFGTAVKVVVTAEDAALIESVATSENVSVACAATVGEVKVGFCAEALDKVTVGEPPVCVHAHPVIVAPSDVVADPCSVMLFPPCAELGLVAALATGGLCVAPGVMFTVALALLTFPALSITARVKVHGVDDTTLGAVKVTVAAVCEDSVTPGPAVCAQA